MGKNTVFYDHTKRKAAYDKNLRKRRQRRSSLLLYDTGTDLDLPEVFILLSSRGR
jgi:hypothetical protein